MSENIQTNTISSRSKEFLSELLEEITDPIHKRIIKTYQGDDPVHSMEIELGKILLEILTRED
jgi:hypothetical protein